MWRNVFLRNLPLLCRPLLWDKLPPRSEEEDELLSELEFVRENSRLTCQIKFSEELDGLTLTIAPEE